MQVLVTGSAGYIGSVVTEKLIEEGYGVIALDNLSQGHRGAVHPEAKFIQADLSDFVALDEVFASNEIGCVMHLAADTVVGYSMTDPARYFRNNVANGIVLLEAMLRHSVKRLVFSSTAAVYGQPKAHFVRESDPPQPINAYGESKLMFERILYWYWRAYGLKSISFRYFNAAGASERFGQDHNPETLLVPNIVKAALGIVERLHIFGTDYETKDGSCVRDYIHVIDIARAHLLALRHIDSLNFKIYNLGNGEGYSVKEVLEVARRVTGAEIPAVCSPRRQGDPAALVANSDLARSELGWEPHYPKIEDIVRSAWEWQKKHPNGYIEP